MNRNQSVHKLIRMLYKKVLDLTNISVNDIMQIVEKVPFE